MVEEQTEANTMTHLHQPVVIDSVTGLIFDETTEDKLADQAAIDLFDNQDDAQKTSGVIADFVHSYSRHKNTLPLEVWLDQEFAKYPDIWVDDAERHETALKVIETVQKNNKTKADLYAHFDKGKSRESWLANKIEQGASSAGVANVGKYAQDIDEALEQATTTMKDIIFNKPQDAGGDLIANGNSNLHGLIAEADLANQFNLNATTSNSTLKAEVLSSNKLHSHDIQIKDATGSVLENIQVKLYKPDKEGLNSLIQNIKSHDYDKNTTLIVTKEHVAPLREKFPDLKIDSQYERDGVKMEMDEYDYHIESKNQAQQQAETKQYEWNDANRMNIAKEIGKKALIGAAFNAGFQGARILGRRVWNSLTGKENRSANEDLQEFFESSIKSTANVGVQVAVSGALVVAVKNGWLTVLQDTPAGKIANIAYVAMENAKCLYKCAKGEMTTTEALDAMGNTTSTAVGGIIGAVEVAALGLAFSGPLGAFVGAVIGGIAGNAIAEPLYHAGKVIVKTAAKVLQSAYEGTTTMAKGVFNTVTFGLFA
ncbi:MAG: hypothetical protein M0R47_06925 [Methylobacter sp.]|uniref:glycine zipper family protein n=1 Tax=Methylobacter sp. TaxID=2051955 RepID=UPI0025D61C46|nr:hypothetical protein [Methylobacter sp.]MCK9620255.1 hypothetical protein [Methylobacter sp.]